MSLTLPTTASEAFLLETLGALRLLNRAGEQIVGPRKELVLLAYIVRHAPKPVSRVELAALFWGDRPETNARQSLRQALVMLKRELGEVIRIGQEHISLACEGVDLDVTLFEQDLTGGRLPEAVRRWTGDFLSGAEDAGTDVFRFWLEAEREGLRTRLIWAFERLVRESQERGEHLAALAWAEQWANLFPADERAHARAVELLRTADRVEDAAARHASFTVRLHEQNGHALSPELQRLSAQLNRELRVPRMRVGAGSVLHEPELVGRGAALEQLAELWSAAGAGKPQIALVEGDAGIGKTRLCEEFLRIVGMSAPRAVVLRAHAYSAAQHSNGEVAHELLAPLALAPGLFGAAPAALGNLASLVPGIRERVRALPDASTDGWAIPDALVAVLKAVSDEEPILLFVDNLPCADEASQRLIVASVTSGGPSQVMVLLTAASDELRDWPLAEALLGSRPDRPPVRRIQLEALSRADVARVIASILNTREADLQPLASRVEEETGGNPYFISEIITTLVREEFLTITVDGAPLLSPSLEHRPLPHSSAAYSMVDRALSTLNPDARRLLDRAAVLGVEFERDAVAAALGVSSAALYTSIDELVGHRLIREVGAGNGRFAFTKKLVHRAVLSRLGPAAGVADQTDSSPTALGAEATGDHSASLTERARDDRADIDGPSCPTRTAKIEVLRSNVAKVPRLLRIAAALVLGAALVGVVTRRGHSRTEDTAAVVLAVGPIAEFPPRDSAHMGAALVDMLATNLARAPGLQVISNARMNDLLGDVSSDGSRSTVLRVAEAAGASELLEGAVHRGPRGVLRLDLRRVDLATGAVRGAFAVDGSDVFALVDSATALVIASLRIRAGPLGIAGVSTSSLLAYQLYSEGLRAYYQKNDVRLAEDLFASAAAVDTNFAMAVYYRAKLAESVGGPMFELLAKADVKAAHASERERLTIRAAAAAEFNEPSAVAVAESLAARYPTDPTGGYFVGRAKVQAGDFLGAIPHYVRTIAMDSLAFRGSTASCIACEAIREETLAYWWADSLPAAERVTRQWIRRQPTSADARETLCGYLQLEGRYPEADSSFAVADQLRRRPAGDRRLARAQLAIRDGHFVEADRLLVQLIREGSPGTTGQPLWFLAISLRTQGRLGEALVAAHRARTGDADPVVGAPITQDALQEGQVLLEAGRPRAAAAIFDSLLVVTVTPDRPYMRWRNARGRAWFLAHRASAAAAEGDSVTLKRLADSLEVVGRESAYGRDRVLHHHARGLLAIIRGRPTEAEAEFRAAIFSPTLGYTRSNLELGRVLLRLERPREAVRILQPALRGVLDASNLYVTRTELHEALAQAFDQAGERDSAVTHYRQVSTAWHSADASFRPRVRAADERLTVLSRRTSTH